jgi:hypothetical protein
MSKRLMLFNLPREKKWWELKYWLNHNVYYLKKHEDEILDCKIMLDPVTKLSKCIAQVQFKSAKAAHAVSMYFDSPTPRQWTGNQGSRRINCRPDRFIGPEDTLGVFTVVRAGEEEEDDDDGKKNGNVRKTKVARRPN